MLHLLGMDCRPKTSEGPRKLHGRKQGLSLIVWRQKVGGDPAVCGAVLEVFPGGSAGDVAYRRGYGGAGCPQVFGHQLLGRR